MSFRLLDAMAREGFEAVHAVHDPDSGMRAVVAIHDTSVGPAFGGVRRWEYASENAAFLDCLRLARAMSWKAALADLPAGGGKSVLIDRGDLDLEGAYRRLGRFVESLGGTYCTGPDVNTGARELAWLASETRYATDPGPDGPRELSEATAAGVFAGVRAAIERLDGEADWPARTIVVQGLGAVGERLCRRLREVGARVLACDLDQAQAERVAGELELELLEPGSELSVACDVFSPNAMGGVIHDLSITRLATRAVCGGANNVLAGASHGEQLHERGVLFVPDVLVNAGALVRGVHFHLEGRREPLQAIEERIGRTTAELLALAAEVERSPASVAVEEARRRIDLRRGLDLAGAAARNRGPLALEPDPSGV